MKNRRKQLIEQLRVLRQEHEDLHYASFGDGLEDKRPELHYHAAEKIMKEAREEYKKMIGVKKYNEMTDHQSKTDDAMYYLLGWDGCEANLRMDEILEEQKPLKRELTIMIFNEYVSNEENDIELIANKLTEKGDDWRLKPIDLSDLRPEVIKRRKD